jgi:hypothetical protein
MDQSVGEWVVAINSIQKYSSIFNMQEGEICKKGGKIDVASKQTCRG